MSLAYALEDWHEYFREMAFYKCISHTCHVMLLQASCHALNMHSSSALSLGIHIPFISQL